MEKIRAFFKADTQYKAQLNTYDKTDGIFAILYFILFMAAYYIMGLVLANTGIYLGIPCNVVLALLPVVYVLLRRQPLSSLGLTGGRIRQAILFAGILGLIFFTAGGILPGITSDARLRSVSSILYNIFYYFIIIGLVEEIAFRGFIQTRIYGLIKNDIAAVLVGAVMFALMHIPFRLAAHQLNFAGFLANAPFLIFWHIFFNFLHRKFNSIYGNTVFHGFMDLCSGIFLG